MLARYVLCSLVIVHAIGCVSTFIGKVGTVSFQSQPAGATVSVVRADGVMRLSGITPTIMLLEHGHDYRITFQKEGYALAFTVLESTFSGLFLMNILSGMIGFVIDAARGLVGTLSGDEVKVNLTALPLALATASAQTPPASSDERRGATTAPPKFDSPRARSDRDEPASASPVPMPASPPAVAAERPATATPPASPGAVVVVAPIAPSARPYRLQLELDVDRTGGDLTGGLAGLSIPACRAACAASHRCLAFTHVPSGFRGAPSTRCVLMHRVRAETFAPGFTSAVR